MAVNESCGKHYNYFRDYDPTIGRYIESDPIGLAGGRNSFSYVGAKPLATTDPLGLAQAGAAIGGFIGGGLGAVGGGILGGGGGAFVCSPGGPAALGCGAVGAAEGAAIGGTLGAALGAAIGSAIEDVCKKADVKPNDDFCARRKNYCITFCQYELDMPGRRDNVGPFRACIRRCMNSVGCDY